MELPLPTPGSEVDWVASHLGDLCATAPVAPPWHPGTQAAADGALAALDLTGYAARRNEVWPRAARGATGLSPWIRHGLITLPQAATRALEVPGNSADRSRFVDELHWQEYARHLYARLGHAMGHGLRAQQDAARPDGQPDSVWDPRMACVDLAHRELLDTGWMVNQTRMWLASHWAVRGGWDWRAGEDAFFRHLLDGSRAANRLGWQWTAGTATGRVYGFARSQVEKRAPGLCQDCAVRDACPIASWPQEPARTRVESDPLLRRDPDPDRTAGPSTPVVDSAPEAVWITAESLGDADPALDAHPDLPVHFVFDAALLARLGLAGMRMVFMAQRLAELGQARTLHTYRGDPVRELAGLRLAATVTPVPGWRRRAARLQVTARHPWPWLRRPDAGSLSSYSAWRGR